MSTPLDRAPGPDDPSPYAPKWAREGARPPRRGEEPGLPGRDLVESSFGRSEAVHPAPRDEDMSGEPFRLPRSLDPTILPKPSRFPRPRAWLGPLGLSALAISAAAVVAWFVVAALPPAGNLAGEQKLQPNSFLSRFAELTVGTGQRSTPPVPQLVVARAAPRGSDDAFPLGVALNGAGKGVALVLGGLPTGSTLSAGRAVGGNGWLLSAAELDNALIRPPRGFAGTLDVLVELRISDGSVVERKSLRFERIAVPAPPRQAVRQLDADELVSLIKRGEEFIATGDLAAARLVLQRAAEGGEARAALALAGTYDPNVLEQLGVKGFAPDVAMAQAWYERAKEFGSAEAPRRLERLASRDH